MRMTIKLVAYCLAVLVLLPAVGTSAEPSIPRVSVWDSPRAVAVYVHDLDLLRRGHTVLTAEVSLPGVDHAYHIDLAAAYQPPAIVIRKAGERSCDQAAVTIRGDDRVLFQQMVMVTAAPEGPGVSLTDETAYIESGSAMVERPVIRQPDLANMPRIAMGEASRTLQLETIAARVIADASFPLVSANNHSALSRQTDHPDDPSRRSMYVPLKMTPYNQQTGRSEQQVHFLAEIPLNPGWLEGEGDAVITLGPRDIRIHTASSRWPTGDPQGVWITGGADPGLGQMSGSMSVSENGNIYFSGYVPPRVIRFNVRTRQFEAPPIDLQAAMDEHLPRDEVPQHLRDKPYYFDKVQAVSATGGRVYIMPTRYAEYAQTRFSGVFSVPEEHWDDAAKFRADLRLVARCWPGSPISLYSHWPRMEDVSGQLSPGVYHDGSYYMASYARHPGGPWRIEINSDGSGRSAHVISDEEVSRAWKAAAPRLRTNASGLVNWWDYGVLETTREKIAIALRGEPDPSGSAAPKDSLTIYYDAIDAMRLDPERNADLLASQTGPSRAPCYMLIDIPDKPGCLLGVAEYGYPLAEFDVSQAAEGRVLKRYLLRELNGSTAKLPAMAGLGPEGAVWWRDGTKHYLVATGYQGISTMLYRNGDVTLDRVRVELIKAPSRSLDGAPQGVFTREQYPTPGLDNRVFIAGANVVDRGGNAFSNGLGVFTPPVPKDIGRLAHMSRGAASGTLLSRMVVDADGRPVQQFILGAGMSRQAYLDMLPDDKKPANHDGKELIYECRPGEEPRDVLGFSLPVVDGQSRLESHVLSGDRRYLVMLYMDRLLSFDLDARRYVDGRQIDLKTVWFMSNPDVCFHRGPDDRIFFAVQEPKARTVAFHELLISPAGELSTRPHLAIAAEHAASLDMLRNGVLAFTADASGDGSYDLCIGPFWRAPGTQMWVIPDFIAARR